MADFKQALDHVLKDEGLYSNNPSDRGSATKYGITRNTLATYRGHAVSISDVQTLSLDEATEIYLKNYWEPLGLENILDQRVATALFSVAVNCGIVVCGRMAQMAAGVKVDGHFGPISIGAVNQMTHKKFLVPFISAVQDHYVNIVLADTTQLTFLRGWINRTQKLMEFLF
jgi:lysozyme family protein